jgi:DNA-binding response OmpR family regulator
MSKKIIVIDDDPGIQDIFRLILQREGFDVQIISNGKDILKNAFTIPDLFILDKQLSGVDGVDICLHLKKQKKTKNIPVIMISASPGIGTLAIEAGADDYLEKPFDIKALLGKIHTCLTVTI